MLSDSFHTTVKPEWIDCNGHMNVAYYVLAFDQAADVFYRSFGVDESYLRDHGGSTFTVEMNVSYRRELRLGEPLRISTQLIGCDAKRLHYYNRMVHAEEGWLAATSECLALHVSLATRRVAPFPDALRARLEQLRVVHAAHPLPDNLGRRIGLPQALHQPGDSVATR